MAFRDTWHRTLVYFGLAEDEAYDDEVEPYQEPEAEPQDTYRERPNGPSAQHPAPAGRDR